MKLAKIVEVSVLRKKKTFKLTADDFFNGLFGRPNGMVKFVCRFAYIFRSVNALMIK